MTFAYRSFVCRIRIYWKMKNEVKVSYRPVQSDNFVFLMVTPSGCDM